MTKSRGKLMIPNNIKTMCSNATKLAFDLFFINLFSHRVYFRGDDEVVLG